jgi:hypothetical protein
MSRTALAIENQISPSRSLGIEVCCGRLGRWNGQLIELQSRKFGSDQVIRRAHVAIALSGC